MTIFTRPDCEQKLMKFSFSFYTNAMLLLLFKTHEKPLETNQHASLF